MPSFYNVILKAYIHIFFFESLFFYNTATRNPLFIISAQIEKVSLCLTLSIPEDEICGCLIVITRMRTTYE